MLSDEMESFRWIGREFLEQHPRTARDRPQGVGLGGLDESLRLVLQSEGTLASL